MAGQQWYTPSILALGRQSLRSARSVEQVRGQPGLQTCLNLRNNKQKPFAMFFRKAVCHYISLKCLSRMFVPPTIILEVFCRQLKLLLIISIYCAYLLVKMQAFICLEACFIYFFRCLVLLSKSQSDQATTLLLSHIPYAGAVFFMDQLYPHDHSDSIQPFS